MITAAQKQEILDGVMVATGRDFQVGDLVEAARDASHEAHSWFEWDDAKCGEAMRKRQESGIVSGLRRVVTLPTVERTPPAPVEMLLIAPREPPTKVKIPAWVANGKQKRVRGETVQGQALLQQEAVHRMREFRERYRALLLVAGVDQMAEFVETALGRLQPPEA